MFLLLSFYENSAIVPEVYFKLILFIWIIVLLFKVYYFFFKMFYNFSPHISENCVTLNFTAACIKLLARLCIVLVKAVSSVKEPCPSLIFSD